MDSAKTPRHAFRWETWAFFVVLAVQVTLVLANSPFPTQDLPAHLESATFGLRLIAGDAGVADVYAWNRRVVPSWMGQVVTSTLVAVLPPEATTKVLILLGMVPLALVMWFVVGKAAPNGRWAALLVLPMIPNWHLHMGFFSFTLAVPIFTALAAWWVLGRGPKSWAAVACAAGGIALLYLLHPVPTGFLLAGLALLELAEWRWGTRRPLGTAVGRIAAISAPTAVCVLLLVASGDASGVRYGIGLGNRIGLLLFQHSLDPFGIVDAAGRIVAAVLWGAATVSVLARHREGWRLRRTDGFLGLALAMAFMHLAAPQAVGTGTFFNQRTSIFAPLLLIPWLGAQPVAPRWSALVASAAIVATGLLGARQVSGYMRLRPMIVEFDQMSVHVPEDATFAVVQDRDHGFLPGIAVNPVANRGGLVTVRTGAVNQTNYEASFGVFPIAFRDPSKDARRLAAYLARGGSLPPDIAPPQYLLLWRPPDKPPLRPESRLWLDGRYELLATTSPTGSGRVYRLRAP